MPLNIPKQKNGPVTQTPQTCQASCKAFWKSVIPNSQLEPFLGSEHAGIFWAKKRG